MKSNVPLTDLPADVHDRLRLLMARHVTTLANGCIEWTGARTEKGYGRFAFALYGRKKNLRAHRVMWILTNGPIDDPLLVIDHLCGFPACVNPEHLELVTNEENLRRADTRRGRVARTFGGNKPVRQPRRQAEFCQNGHRWSENTAIRDRSKDRREGATTRYCIACNRERSRLTYLRATGRLGD